MNPPPCRFREHISDLWLMLRRSRRRSIIGVAAALEWEDRDVAEGRWPGGTLTLVLGDIESSTERWEASPTEMAAAMEQFNVLVDELAGAHDGVREREQGEGDNFVIAFSGCSDALRFAVEVQRPSNGGPTGPRIGLHTGEVVTHADGSHGGPTIIRAARIRDAGHGGQVLLSNATAMLAADHLEECAGWSTSASTSSRGSAAPSASGSSVARDLQTDHPALRIAASAPPLPPSRHRGSSVVRRISASPRSAHRAGLRDDHRRRWMRRNPTRAAPPRRRRPAVGQDRLRRLGRGERSSGGRRRHRRHARYPHRQHTSPRRLPGRRDRRPACPSRPGQLRAPARGLCRADPRPGCPLLAAQGARHKP